MVPNESIGSSEFQIMSYMKPNMSIGRMFPTNDNNDFVMKDGNNMLNRNSDAPPSQWLGDV